MRTDWQNGLRLAGRAWQRFKDGGGAQRSAAAGGRQQRPRFLQPDRLRHFPAASDAKVTPWPGSADPVPLERQIAVLDEIVADVEIGMQPAWPEDLRALRAILGTLRNVHREREAAAGQNAAGGDVGVRLLRS